MNERIRELRKILNLTMEKFGIRLGVGKTAISKLENGERNLTDQMFKAICREFNVREEWLRNGSGSMFKPESSDALHQLRQDYSLSEADYVMVEKFVNLSPEVRKALFHYMQEVSAAFTNTKNLRMEASSELVPSRVICYCQRLASAGGGEYLFDDIPTELIKVKDTPEAGKADFVIGVNGDSMEPDYYDGEKVFVEKTPDIETGEVGVFVQGSECYIKECGEHGLISRNKKYPGVEPLSEGIKIVGRVIGKAREIK